MRRDQIVLQLLHLSVVIVLIIIMQCSYKLRLVGIFGATATEYMVQHHELCFAVFHGDGLLDPCY